ncbi:hypothetical protein ACFXPA_29195 [Amycolatopsis sp. NPDC059090]|uniref:hypothetical protein n=1 Tax=Amycolatopsis sp. NPDC059090 TaxID=3346723 RepID=UPI00366C4532
MSDTFRDVNDVLNRIIEEQEAVLLAEERQGDGGELVVFRKVPSAGLEKGSAVFGAPVSRIESALKELATRLAG